MDNDKIVHASVQDNFWWFVVRSVLNNARALFSNLSFVVFFFRTFLPKIHIKIYVLVKQFVIKHLTVCVLNHFHTSSTKLLNPLEHQKLVLFINGVFD